MNWPAFANPWLLAGLVAVGLPVLIHYLTRARPRRVAFPPFKFLLEACAGQQAVHRLRTIVLLTVRCLAVLALVLLFARPFVKPSGAVANPEVRRRVVLILDASLSMRAVQGGVSLFARAKAEAADVLRGLESGQEAAKGNAEAMMWTCERQDGGRGFGWTGGHHHKNWGNDNYRKVVLNAILWLAKVEVPPNGLESSVSADDLARNLDRKGRR